MYVTVLNQIIIYSLLLAKWNKLEMHHTPVAYMKQLLFDLNPIEVNSVKETTHWRPPMLHSSTTRISYKSYSMDSLETAFNEAGATLKKTAQWSDEKEIESEEEEEIQTAADAIIVAMRRNKKMTWTCSSELKIHDGSKPTRELEVIWWPHIYSSEEYGKLSLRFYVGKVSM